MAFPAPGLQVLKTPKSVFLSISLGFWILRFFAAPRVFSSNRVNHHLQFCPQVCVASYFLGLPNSRSASPISFFLATVRETSAGLFGFSFARFAFVFCTLAAAHSSCVGAPLVPWPNATASSRAASSTGSCKRMVSNGR